MRFWLFQNQAKMQLNQQNFENTTLQQIFQLIKNNSVKAIVNIIRANANKNNKNATSSQSATYS